MHSADICSGSEFKAPMVPSTAWRPRPPSGRGCPLGRRAEEAGPTALCLRCSLTGGAVRCRVGGPSAARPCLRNLACRAGAGGAVAAGDSAASGSPQQQAARRQRHQRRGHDVVGLAGCARARWSPELRGPEWGRTTRPLLQGRARRSGAPTARQGGALPLGGTGAPRAPGSGGVVDLLQPVDLRLQAQRAGLQLEREVERVAPVHLQVAAVHPQPLHLRGLPHVPELALPGARVARGARAQAPDLPEPRGDLSAQELRGEVVDWPVARGEDHGVGGQHGPVLHHDALAREPGDLAHLQADLAAGDQLGGSAVKVIPLACPHELHEVPGAVLAEVDEEPPLPQPVEDARVQLLHLGARHPLSFRERAVRDGREDQVGLLRVYALLHGRLRVQVAAQDVAERLAPNDGGGRPLHHGGARAVGVQVGANVVGGRAAPDHHDPLPGVGRARDEAGGVDHLAVLAKLLLPLEGGHAREPVETGCQHELFRCQPHGLTIPLNRHGPLPRRAVPSGGRAPRIGPVIDAHDLHVHLQPVRNLILAGIDWPRLRELHVGQVRAPDGVVQRKGVVARAPLVPRARAALEHHVRHAERCEARPQGDARLAAPDDDDVWLRLGAPVLHSPAAARAVRRPRAPERAAPLLVAFEGLRGCAQRPAALLAELDVARAARHRRLERDLGLDHAVRLRGLAHQGPAGGLDVVQRRRDHVADGVAALHGLDVPRESHEVPPVAVRGEEPRHGLDVAGQQRVLEAPEPRGRVLRGARVPAHRGDWPARPCLCARNVFAHTRAAVS
mmetsp:Transcript_14521/g.38603  ORF Transcript_14521/g.38603 Transcript_14521/m.38603 type:complete len:787 (-) Transcript_14521:9-2369(-)